MNYYCTLFDSNYLTRGLVMYQSILETAEDFHLYVVCFDNIAFKILQQLALVNVTLISLAEFETEVLLAVKNTRTRGEYCWTCTPHIIRYILDEFQLPELTYLDADLYFFQKPSVLLEEFRETNKDVMITEHRYTPVYDQSRTSGMYCVQFVTFRRSEKGLVVLQWWQDRCTEWCYARYEDGKFGDQKYLDDWLTQFDCVHVLQHLGGGIAPWNIQQYKVDQGPQVNNTDVVFYHFHGLKWFNHDRFDLGDYTLSPQTKEILYRPYICALRQALKLVQENENSSFARGIQTESYSWKNLIRRLRRKIKGEYNVIQG